jgi:1-acyl-sn-glycerol-3-phosphate acyltransferase
MLGHDRSKPVAGLRGWVNKTYCQLLIGLSIRICGMSFETKFVDFDYSKYLGPDYLKTQKLPAKASTIVSNHQGSLDSLILICTPMMPGFAAKVETKKIWILNAMIEAVQSLFI